MFLASALQFLVQVTAALCPLTVHASPHLPVMSLIQTEPHVHHEFARVDLFDTFWCDMNE